MKDNFDAIIIGSGLGDSVLAARLTESGKKFLVLERGAILCRLEVPVSSSERNYLA